MVNSLNGVSSREQCNDFAAHIRRYLRGRHFWSPSYFAGSRGGAPLKGDIAPQKRPPQRA
jgi:putative transposase